MPEELGGTLAHITKLAEGIDKDTAGLIVEHWKGPNSSYRSAAEEYLPDLYKVSIDKARSVAEIIVKDRVPESERAPIAQLHMEHKGTQAKRAYTKWTPEMMSTLAELARDPAYQHWGDSAQDGSLDASLIQNTLNEQFGTTLTPQAVTNRHHKIKSTKIRKLYDVYGFGAKMKSFGVAEVVINAQNRDIDTICMISSGNYLDAVLNTIDGFGVKNAPRVVNLVNSPTGRDDHTEIVIEDQRVLMNAAEREEYVREHLPDAGTVKDYTDFIPSAMKGYISTYVVGRNLPEYFALGVGTGKLFLTLYEIIKEKDLDTKLIGVVPRGENGIFNQDNLFVDREGRMHYKEFDPTSVADKLSTPYTIFRDQVLSTTSEGHMIVEASNAELLEANVDIQHFEQTCEISGSAGFVVSSPLVRVQYGLPNDAHVRIINTG